MANESKKYLDLEGLGIFKTNADEEYANKTDLPDAKLRESPAVVKVGRTAKGYVDIGEAVTYTDIKDLTGYEDKNQTIKSGTVTFGDSAVVNIEGSGSITVTPDAANNKITISHTDSGNDNQKVSAGGATFGVNDTVDFEGSGLTVTGNTANKKITIAHPAGTATGAAAVKVGSDAYGHVVLGAALQYSDIEGTPTIGNGTLTIQANGTSKGTFSANQTADTTINITAADLGLSAAMQFIGVSTTDPKSASGATVSGHTTWKKGEVVIYKRGTAAGYEEYVNIDGKNTAASWELLGDADSYALKSIKVEAGAGLNGGGDLTANRTISHNSYAKQSAAALKIGCDATGHVVVGDALSIGSDGAHTHSLSATVTVPTVDSTNTKLGISATTVSVVTQVNPASGKLDIASIRGVDGSTTASKVSVTAKTASKATAGTAVAVATIDKAVVYGTADRATSPTSVVVGFTGNKQAFEASYTNEVLTLTPITLASQDIYQAVNAPNTQTIVSAKSNGTITPYTFTDVTCSVVSASDVTVPVAADAVNVATGSISASGTGAGVVTSVSAPSTTNVIATASLVDGQITGISVINGVTTGSATATVTGTATSAGAHTHAIL